MVSFRQKHVEAQLADAVRRNSDAWIGLKKRADEVQAEPMGLDRYGKWEMPTFGKPSLGSYRRHKSPTRSSSSTCAPAFDMRSIPSTPQLPRPHPEGVLGRSSSAGHIRALPPMDTQPLKQLQQFVVSSSQQRLQAARALADELEMSFSSATSCCAAEVSPPLQKVMSDREPQGAVDVSLLSSALPDTARFHDGTSAEQQFAELRREADELRGSVAALAAHVETLTKVQVDDTTRLEDSIKSGDGETIVNMGNTQLQREVDESRESLLTSAAQLEAMMVERDFYKSSVAAGALQSAELVRERDLSLTEKEHAVKELAVAKQSEARVEQQRLLLQDELLEMSVKHDELHKNYSENLEATAGRVDDEQQRTSLQNELVELRAQHEDLHKKYTESIAAKGEQLGAQQAKPQGEITELQDELKCTDHLAAPSVQSDKAPENCLAQSAVTRAVRKSLPKALERQCADLLRHRAQLQEREESLSELLKVASSQVEAVTSSWQQAQSKEVELLQLLDAKEEEVKAFEEELELTNAGYEQLSQQLEVTNDERDELEDEVRRLQAANEGLQARCSKAESEAEQTLLQMGHSSEC